MKSILLLIGIVLSKTTLFAAQPAAANPAAMQRQMDRVYSRGLEFLRSHQKEDGTFAQEGVRDHYGKQPGVVGLAVMAMLAHEQDPNQGPYAKSIGKGLNFILRNQNPGTGYIHASMYNHGYATMALAKAKGKVKDPRLKLRLEAALQKAVDLILAAQKRSRKKAWRYSPESADADVCVTGCILEALFAAREAGIKVPDVAIDNGLTFIQQCQNADGGIGYTGPGGSNLPRTAIGVTMLALRGPMGELRKNDSFTHGMKYLVAKEKEQGAFKGHYQHYQIYYVSRAMYHGRHKSWPDWSKANFQQLQETQLPNGSWSGNFGPSLTTCFALLSLAPSLKPKVEKDRVESDLRYILGKPKGDLTPADRAAYANSFPTRLRKLAMANERTAEFIKQHFGDLIGRNIKDLPEPLRAELLKMAREHEKNAQVAWYWPRQLERLALVEKKFGWAKLAGRVQVDQPSVKQDNIASILKKGGVGSAVTKCKELAKQYKAWAKELEGLKD